MRSSRRTRNLTTSLWLLLGFASIANDARADLIYPDFSSTTGLSLLGNAAQFGNAVRLTPSARSMAGAAWYAAEQYVAYGFETTFTFRLTAPFGYGADGFAFVVQAKSNQELGFNGYNLGYGGFPAQSIAVGIDTYIWEDIIIGSTSTNEIRVQGGGTADELTALGRIKPAANLTDGQVHTVQILYEPGLIRAFLDGVPAYQLAVPLNLRTFLGSGVDKAFVGFTASTGQDGENHDILSWSFREVAPPVPEPATIGLLASALVVVLRRARAGRTDASH